MVEATPTRLSCSGAAMVKLCTEVPGRAYPPRRTHVDDPRFTKWALGFPHRSAVTDASTIV